MAPNYEKVPFSCIFAVMHGLQVTMGVTSPPPRTDSMYLHRKGSAQGKRYHFTLTLNCIRYPALPLVHNGGVPWNPPQRKPLSHWNFLIIFTPYVYTLITTIFQGKKYKIFVPFQNGGQITDFHFATFRFRPKFEKPLSQRNFSMKFGSN